MESAKEATIICRGAGLFDFVSGENNYTVDIINKSCTCKSFFYTKLECKHLKIVNEFKSRTGKIRGALLGNAFIEC